MNDRLLATLRKLRLSGLAQTLDVRLQEAAGHNLSHAEFLELILQDELSVRGDRLIERRTRAACFRDQKSLDDFDWDFNRSVKRKQIFDLAAGEFVRRHRDVLLLGPPGPGTYCYTSCKWFKQRAIPADPAPANARGGPVTRCEEPTGRQAVAGCCVRSPRGRGG